MPRLLVAAAVQAAPVFLDREATVEKAAALVAQAAERGARLVAFPETWIPGYPAWIFGAAGWDDAAAKRAYGRLHANAVEVPGPATERLCEAAAAARAHVVVGINERDGGTLYNSVLTISDAGEVLGVHRKLMPTHAERIVWGLGDGSTLHVFDTSVGRVGSLACWEHWMPLARFALHARREEIHVAAWPEVGDPELHRLASRHYAFEGRCYVLCVIGAPPAPELLPDDFELRDLLPGAGAPSDRPGTAIFGPDGAVVAEAPAGEETIVVAELDLDRIAQEQQALDVAGHYNRPDVFRLEIDERPRTQVDWRAGS